MASILGCARVLPVVVSLCACGARTNLELAGSADGSGAAGAVPDGCARLDDPTPVRIGGTVQHFGDMASDGCSFGATWAENQNGTVTLVATTFHPVGGAWQASPVVSIAPVAVASGPAIAWDGSGYVIAWADQVLFLQRMAPDGSLIGAPKATFDAPGSAYVDWLALSEDGSLRVGFRSDSSGSYQAYFARVTPMGGLVVPPKQLTDEGNVDTAGFTRDPDDNTLVSTYRDSRFTFLVQTRFDDQGARLEGPMTLGVGNFFVSRHGTAYAGGSKHYGFLDYSNGPKLLLGWLADAGGTSEFGAIPGAAGGDVPVLAATGTGRVGVLAASTRRPLGPGAVDGRGPRGDLHPGDRGRGPVVHVRHGGERERVRDPLGGPAHRRGLHLAVALNGSTRSAVRGGQKQQLEYRVR